MHWYWHVKPARRAKKDILTIGSAGLANLHSYGITQHYAEIFAAVFDISPLVFLYPKGEFKKSKEIIEVERRAKQFKKHG